MSDFLAQKVRPERQESQSSASDGSLKYDKSNKSDEAILVALHPARKRITKACAFLFCSAAVMTAQLNSVEAQEKPTPTPSLAPEKPLPFTIAKDTTFLTEPLTEEDLVDYDNAINLRNSFGVTSENNSSVLILQAMGPRIWPSDMSQQSRSAYLHWLGLDAFPVSEKCFVDFKDFVRTKHEQPPANNPKKEEDEYWIASEQAWTRESHPLLADWLDSNQAALDLFVVASKRAKRFDPIVGDDASNSFDGFFVMPEAYRVAVRALSIRAMYQIGSADIDAACDDILAIFRLGRLIDSTNAQGLTEALYGPAIAAVGATRCNVLLNSNKATSEQLARLCDGLRHLTDPIPLSQVLDQGERFMVLRAVQSIATEVAKEKREKLDELLPDALVRLISADEKPDFNWDQILRKINVRYDEFTDALRMSSFRERGTKLGGLWQQFEKDLESRDSFWKLGLLTAKQGIHNVEIDSIELALMSTFYPATYMVDAARMRCTANVNMAILAVLTEKYFLERGTYPKALVELVPKYISELPLDPFVDEPFHYGVEPDGFFLYSVGANCRDDGGKHYLTSPNHGDPNKNDVVFRIQKVRPNESPAR